VWVFVFFGPWKIEESPAKTQHLPIKLTPMTDTCISITIFLIFFVTSLRFMWSKPHRCHCKVSDFCPEKMGRNPQNLRLPIKLIPVWHISVTISPVCVGRSYRLSFEMIKIVGKTVLDCSTTYTRVSKKLKPELVAYYNLWHVNKMGLFSKLHVRKYISKVTKKQGR